jgi:hypothetical protein
MRRADTTTDPAPLPPDERQLASAVLADAGRLTPEQRRPAWSAASSRAPLSLTSKSRLAAAVRHAVYYKDVRSDGV